MIVFQPTLSLQQKIFSAIERSWPVHLLDSTPDSQFLPEEFTCEEELYILPQKYAYEYKLGMFLAKMLYFTSFFLYTFYLLYVMMKKICDIFRTQHIDQIFWH